MPDRLVVSCLLAGSSIISFNSLAEAASYYVSPDGAGDVCTRAEPCALSSGAALAQAGDTVYLMDGVYHEALLPQNSGTPDAWITFQADQCALPIIEGGGENAVLDDNGNQPSGVWSSTGTYLRFIGIVSRYWDTGFANGWTGEIGDNSNGHWEIINCIGEGNGRSGMVMYSATGFTVRESIAAHNGGNPAGSWSSAIQMYSVYGTPEDNVIERNVSFENYDAEKNNDGSGFIVDEQTQGATFINNIGFRNGGSCMRLTRSHNTRMLNFTCFHNGQNPLANSPTNPGELYWTDQESRDTTTLANSIAAASGSDTDPEALRFPPESGLSNNLTVDSGATPFFSDPEGQHPDFRPPSSAAAQVENQGTTNGAPDVDIGFDPKCIVKGNPNAPYQQTWWIYSIDYDYIRSIGGVANCFHPKQRSGGPDLGAYELSGEPHAFSEPGSCVPDEDRDPGTTVATAAAATVATATSGTGGSSSTVSSDVTSATGADSGGSGVSTGSGVGGATGSTAGSAVDGATGSTAGSGVGGASSSTTGSGVVGPSATIGSTTTGAEPSGSSAGADAASAPGNEGCGCRLPGGPARPVGGLNLVLAMLGLSLFVQRRRSMY